VRDVDAHRTRRLTGTTQRRRMRQMRVLLDTVVQRSQDAADRTGIDSAISMTANAPINGARIQARPATDALQALAEGAAQDARAAIVQQDQVKLFRAIQLTWPARAGED